MMRILSFTIKGLISFPLIASFSTFLFLILQTPSKSDIFNQYNSQQIQSDSEYKSLLDISRSVTHVYEGSDYYFRIDNGSIYYLDSVDSRSMTPVWIYIGNVGNDIRTLSIKWNPRFPFTDDFQIVREGGDSAYLCNSDYKVYVRFKNNPNQIQRYRMCNLKGSSSSFSPDFSNGYPSVQILSQPWIN